MFVNPLSVDGVLVIGGMDSESANQLSIVPSVFLCATGEKPEVTRADWVWLDDIIMAKHITNCLIEQGHKRIGTIVHSRSEAVNRITGYREALEEAGIEFDPGLIWEKHRCIYPDLLKEILDHSPSITGLLAFTGTDHPVIICTLRALGCKIPDDMSYVAWTCPEYSSLAVLPQITRLDHPFGKAGIAAVRRLMKRIDEPNLPAESWL